MTPVDTTRTMMPDPKTIAQDERLRLLHGLAALALRRYDLGAIGAIRLLNLSENAMFRVQASQGDFVLRLHREGYHSRTAIASELAWEIALRRDRVVTTPAPVAGRDGDFIQDVASAAGDQPRHAVLFRWEDGVEPRIGEDLAGPAERLGEIAARMHIHARGWRRPAWFTRLTWDFDTSLGEETPHWGRWRDGLGMTPEATSLFARTVGVIGRRLAAYGKGPERFGLIHSDLRLANLLVDGPAVKVIDFDDCGFGWYMYDAATLVSFYEHEPEAAGLIEHWKAGYRRVLAIGRDEEAEIPTFVMLRRILLVAWVASHIEAEFPRSLGAGFTQGTLPLCEDYLRRFA